MKGVELYGQVRYAVQIEGLSRREAARRFGIDPRTVAKMLAFSVPPGYRRSRPPARPKLDRFTGIIDGILAADESRPRKQRHTSKRIFERLRDEHGYGGGITIVKDYVLARRLRHRQVFVPLRHDPGHAQVDFGEALAEIAGVNRWGAAMPQPNDLSRSLVALDQNSTIIAVVEMSQSSWLVGVLPGIERQPRKKLEPNPERLLALLHRWRDAAVRAGPIRLSGTPSSLSRRP